MPIFYLKKYCTHTICLLIFCFAAVAFAQNTDAVTFQQSLKEKSFDSILDDFYAHKNSDSLKAAIIITYIKDNFLKSSDENKIAESYLTISAWKDKNGNFEEAIANVDAGIQIATSVNNKKLLYEGYSKKGIYLFERGDNIPALANYTKAIEVSKETGNIKRQLIASNNVALIKIQVSDNLGAIEVYLENLATIENSGDESLEPIKLQLYLAITKAYINLDQYGKAAFYCDKGLTMSFDMNSTIFQARFYTFLGEISSNLGNIEKAHDSLEKAYELLEKAGGDPILDVFLKLYMGKTYFFEKKYDAAISELLIGEELIKKLNVDFLSIQELYIYLAKSYLAAGDIKESSRYFNKANDIYTKNDKKRAIIHSKITQNTLDSLEAEINVIRTKSRKNKNFYFTGITVLVLIIVGLILFFRKQQQKNKKRFDQLMLQLEEKRQKVKINQENQSTPKQVNIIESQKNGREQPAEIDPKMIEILESLEDFEQKELYLSKESTLIAVAKKIQTNTTYLSKVINTHKEKTFTAYITDLRVDYAIERLSHDRKFRSFTIGAIAQEIGFKRSESFSKAFKVKTGLYPSYFIKELEKQIDRDSH